MDSWFEQVQHLSLFSKSENINSQTFQNFKCLQYLKIEDSILKIETNSFETLTNLLHLTLDGCDCIPEFLFQNLKNLKELKIVFNGSVWCVLNKKNFHGLVNLETLSLTRCDLTEDLDNLPSLKNLSLYKIEFRNIFSFKGLEKLEKLILCIAKNRFLPYKKEDLFANLKHLKHLKHLEYVDKMNDVTIDKIFRNTPKSVEVFACDYDFFVALTKRKTSVDSKLSSFIYGIKTLNLKFDFDNDTFLFHDGHLFPNLEKINLVKASSLRKKEYIDAIIPVKGLNKIKNLKNLNLGCAILIEDNNDLINLEELFLKFQVPTKNINNFLNLKKLSLSNLLQKIVLTENFLENLVNLEDLSLNSVFVSIDPNVQFLFKRLIKLKELSIVYNPIRTIKSTYFQYLVNLQKLNLTSNRIELIEPYAFKTLANLNHLDLSLNWIEELDIKILDGLYNLNILEIKANFGRIHFQRDNLSHMVNLERLNFEY